MSGPQPTLVVPTRFRGPPVSGNGGWTSGALATMTAPDDAVGRAVEVTLRMPPPLERPMPVSVEVGRHVARDGDRVVAEARAVDAGPTPVEAVPAEVARAAEAAYAGLRSHPFPSCFACGVGREPGDGLRIFPGPVGAPDAGRAAATWTPHPSLAAPGSGDGPLRTTAPIAWAALDCIGAWSGEDVGERPIVLGRMTAVVDACPLVGEEHVVVGERRGVEGRKIFTAATLYAADGRVVGRAEHVWFSIDPADFTGG